jgi:cell division transport system permease protein
MSLSYTLRESISGFKRAQLSSVISVVTICISLILLGIFFVITLQTNRLLEYMRDTLVKMEAFIEEPVSGKEIQALKAKVEQIDGVDHVEFVSKDDAANIFKQETGDDIRSILEFNPLPPSFRVSLKPAYQTAANAEKVYRALSTLSGIDTVRYRREIPELLDSKTVNVYTLTLGLGVVIGLSAIFLVSNTIRLAIHGKRRLIHTMELVGATRSFIRLPFLLEGIIQGFFGGCIAVGLFYPFIRFATLLLPKDIADFFHMDPTFYALLLGGGIVLGLTGSVISVIRFIRSSDAR